MQRSLAGFGGFIGICFGSVGARVKRKKKTQKTVLLPPVLPCIPCDVPLLAHITVTARTHRNRALTTSAAPARTAFTTAVTLSTGQLWLHFAPWANSNSVCTHTSETSHEDHRTTQLSHTISPHTIASDPRVAACTSGDRTPDLLEGLRARRTCRRT